MRKTLALFASLYMYVVYRLSPRVFLLVVLVRQRHDAGVAFFVGDHVLSYI